MTKFKNFFFIDQENDTYTIRMTPELQDDLGTVGYVEFTEEEAIKVGDSFMNVEASKTVYEAQAPIGGRIVERNIAATDQPELLNSEKAEENWLIKLVDVDSGAYSQLPDA